MIRSSHHNVEVLHAELRKTHAYRRMLCVPVDVPSSYARYLRSAAHRSFGPGEDAEKSGVDFTMHTVGRRCERKTDVGDDPEDVDVAGDDEDLEDVAADNEDEAMMDTADPHMMTARQLRITFKDSALEMQSVLFQHSTRITAFASFLDNGTTP